eukprot:14096412-Ditylum_brightwellii.AAC.1
MDHENEVAAQFWNQVKQTQVEKEHKELYKSLQSTQTTGPTFIEYADDEWNEILTQQPPLQPIRPEEPTG